MMFFVLVLPLVAAGMASDNLLEKKAGMDHSPMPFDHSPMPLSMFGSIYINDTEYAVDYVYEWQKNFNIMLDIDESVGLTLNFSSWDESVRKYKAKIKVSGGGQLSILCGGVQANQTLRMTIIADGQKFRFNEYDADIYAETNGSNAKIVLNRYMYSWYDYDFLTCVITGFDGTPATGPSTDPTPTDPEVTTDPSPTDPEVTTPDPSPTDPEVTTPGPASPPPSGSCRCGMKNSNQRIIGGTQVTGRELPWQVLVSSGCGGSIISSRFVVTAAHCTQGTVDFVAVGADNWRQGTRVGVKNIIDHPNYDGQVGNDISLLELDQELTFDADVSPICLPDVDVNFEGRDAVASGYGKTSEDAWGMTDDLMKVDQVVGTTAQCRQSWGGFFNPSQMTCVTISPGKSTCNGDSGGPLQIKVGDNYQLIGAVSYGAQSGCLSAHNVFARVQSYVDWIQGVVNGAGDSFCSR